MDKQFIMLETFLLFQVTRNIFFRLISGEKSALVYAMTCEHESSLFYSTSHLVFLSSFLHPSRSCDSFYFSPFQINIYIYTYNKASLIHSHFWNYSNTSTCLLHIILKHTLQNKINNNLKYDDFQYVILCFIKIS